MNTHLARIPRYTLVSIACAALHNVILIAADAAGLGIVVCQLLSAAILLPFGFILQSQFTFACERSWRGFARYSTALITNFPIALLALWLSREVAGLSMWVAAPFSSLVLYCWNFATSTWALAPRQGVQARG